MRSGAAPYLTAPPQGPLVGQLVLPGEIPAPLLARPKGLGEGAGLPVVHAGEEVSAVPSPCLGKPRGRITGRQVLFPESGPGGGGVPGALPRRHPSRAPWESGSTFPGETLPRGQVTWRLPGDGGRGAGGLPRDPQERGEPSAFRAHRPPPGPSPGPSPSRGARAAAPRPVLHPLATLAASSPVPLCFSRGRGRLRPREPRPAALPARGHSRFRGPGPRSGPSRAGTAPPGPPRPPPPPCGSRPRPGRPARLPASAAAG